MSVQIASLASGALQASTAQIYLSPSGPPALTTIIKGIRLVNKDSVSRAVNLYVKRATGDPTQPTNGRTISPVNVMIPAGATLIDDQEITLSSGDIINGDTNGVTTSIDYFVSGIQR